MKKTLAILIIIIRVLLFIGSILIAIYSPKLPAFVATYGFIVTGYLSIAVFTFGIFKYFDKK